MKMIITTEEIGNARSTGIVRKVDDLGRVVLPKELRKIIGIKERDPMEITVLGEFILLHKYTPICALCSRTGDLMTFRGKPVCMDCRESLSNGNAGDDSMVTVGAPSGIVRKLDDLGRIVLPKEYRQALYVDERDPLEVFILGEYVLLHKYEPACIFCGTYGDGMELYNGKQICLGCKLDLVKPA